MFVLGHLSILLICCELTRYVDTATHPSGTTSRYTSEWETPTYGYTQDPSGDPCNGLEDIITESTTIDFPLYNTYYENYARCVWRIIAPVDYIVRVTFRMVNIENCGGTECDCDSVTTYNGNLTTPLHKICGFSPGPPLYSNHNRMDLVFTSDYSGTYQGFIADVDFIYSPNWQTTMAPEDPTTWYPSGDDPCNGTEDIITERTTIDFPSYNYYYENNAECVWRIIAPVDYIVKVTFRMVNIEDCWECVCDNVTTYNGDLTTPLHELCGFSPGPPMYSNHNRMDLVFTSDGSWVYQGFIADVDFIYSPSWQTTMTPEDPTTWDPTGDDPCNGLEEIITDNTTIIFPSTNLYYENDARCVWRIIAPVDYIVEVTFRMVDIEECTECVCDSLTTYNGDLTTPLHKICRPVLPVYSYHNRMDLVFTSDHSGVYQGFIADVGFIYRPNVAFFAVKITNIEATTEPLLVEFDDIIINLYESFYADQFICPIAGDYFFSLSAGAVARKPVGLILRKNGVPFVSLVRKAVQHDDVDTLSRSVIMPLDRGDVVDLVVDRYTSAYSNNYFQTSLTGFLVPFIHEFTDTSFFAAQVHNDTSYSSNCEPMNLEKRLVGGSEWGEGDEQFQFPHQGIYMSSMSAGLNGSMSTDGGRIELVNNGTNIANIRRTSTTYIGFDTLSRDIMVDVTAGDTFGLQSCGTPVYSTQELQTSLSMYAISSSSRIRPLFSAAKTSSVTESGIVTGYTTMVQVGSGFVEATGVFTCAVPGVYLVSFSAGVYLGYPVDLELMVDSSGFLRVQGGLDRFSTSHNGIDTMSRSLLVDLSSGDEMFLGLAPGSRLFSDTGKQTSFSAFLLDASGSLNGTLSQASVKVT